MNGLKEALAKTLNGGKIDAAVVAKKNNIIYLVVSGAGKISLKKDGNNITVLESPNEEIIGASGKDNNDSFILTTSGLEKTVVFSKASWLKKFLPKKDLYLRPQTFGLTIPGEVKNHKQLITTVLVLLFLIWAVYRQVSYRLENDAGVKLDKAIVKAEEQIKTAKELAVLNRPLARETLENEKKNFVGIALPKAKEMVAKIDAQINILMQKFSAEPVLYYDFSLIKEGSTSGSGVYMDGKLFFLDQNSGTLLSLNTKTKSAAPVVSDEKFKTAKFISAHSDRVYLYTNDGIYRTNDNKKVLMVKPDPKWQEIIAMESFGGNLYLLDKKANQIWKHVSTETGFTDARPYLNPDTKVDFSNSATLGIDGSVYTLLTSGELLKFTQGRSDALTLTGADKPIISGGGLAISDSLKNIYIYDSENNRVVVFGPDGLYISQYIFLEPANIPLSGNEQASRRGSEPTIPSQLVARRLISGTYSSIFVDETLQKIFLLNGAKVYSVELK